MKRLLSTTAAVLILASAASADPWPQDDPNTDFQPAFPEQTRAPAMDSGVTLKDDLTGVKCKYCGASFAANGA